MSKYLGIDLGTANTLVYMRGKGIILREPSVVAVDQAKKKVVAVGSEAKNMIGKTPGNIAAFHPLRDGVIADFDVTAKMLRAFFGKVNALGVLSRPTVVICIPRGVTEVGRRAVEDATFEAGAKNVALIDEPMAAAIGAGLRVCDARGSMIVDIGGGTTEVAVICLGGIVRSSSRNDAGNLFDDAIVQYFKREHKILIGEGTAEQLKTSIGSVHESVYRGELEIRGRNLRSGLPAVMTVNSRHMLDAMIEPAEAIIETIRKTLENTPAELSADLYDLGIMLTGGGALIGGLPELIRERLGIRVTVARKPLDSVAIGLGRAVEGRYPDLVKFRSR